jgi:hypothetical protein
LAKELFDPFTSLPEKVMSKILDANLMNIDTFILNAIDSNEPVLLVGPTGSKNFRIKKLDSEAVVVHCSSETNVASLVGYNSMIREKNH